jgi:hypothetical protein
MVPIPNTENAYDRCRTYLCSSKRLNPSLISSLRVIVYKFKILTVTDFVFKTHKTQKFEPQQLFFLENFF